MRHYLFMVPFGKAGTEFITELTYLNSYGIASALECIALKAAMEMPVLLHIIILSHVTI